MAKFLVRLNVEYSQYVEAETEQAAIDEALLKPLDEWDRSSSQAEAEEDA